MSLYDYLENTKGVGVLATADNNGIVDTGLYSDHILLTKRIAYF